MIERERTILITGATSGLGRELSGSLSTASTRLILHGRDRAALEELRSELRGSAEQVDTVSADLADLSQVRTMAEEVAAMTDQLTVLVNNAGIGKGSHDRRELSSDGFELRLAVNHLAPFALTLRLLPLLRAGAPSRIVNVASGAQEPIDPGDLHLERDYTGSRAYAQSKAAMITCGFTLAEQLPPRVTTVNSLHPATLMPTRMVEEGYGYTVDDLATGVAATRHLIESADVDGVTGAFFNGTKRSQAIPQTYDPDFQSWMWRVSQDLTGTAL